MSRGSTYKFKSAQDSILVGSVQDTIPQLVRQDSIVSLSNQDSVLPATDSLMEESLSPDDIQLLFEQSNQRQVTIDSITLNIPRPYSPTILGEDSEPLVFIDSSHVIFLPDSAGLLPPPSFNLDLPRFSYRKAEDSGTVFIEGAERELNHSDAETGVETTHPDSTPMAVVKEKVAVSNDWILGVVLVSFIVLAWVRLFYNKFLSPTFMAVINQQVSHNLFRDKSGVSFRVSLGLNLIFYLNGGLYLYLLLGRIEVDPFGLGGFWTFSILCLILVGLYLVKHVVTFLVGVISLTQGVFAEYMHNVFLFNKNLGLVLYPVVLGMVYMSDLLIPFFFYAGIGFVGIVYLLRLIRGFQIFIKEGVSILYWILYLCALEILPLLLFLKLSGLLVW